MPDLSFSEILVVLIVGLILFGPGRITEAAKALGKSMGAFKQGLKEGNEPLVDKKIEKTEETTVVAQLPKDQEPRA